MKDIRSPTLVLYGSVDQLTDPSMLTVWRAGLADFRGEGVLHLDQSGVIVIAEDAIAIGRTIFAETALGTHDHCNQLTFQFDNSTNFFNHNSFLSVFSSFNL